MTTVRPPLAAWLEEAWADEAVTGSVSVEGADVAYRGWGLDRRDLPGVLLVHGYQAHARWWDHVGPRLAERHRVVAVDLTGMGDSGHRGAYSRALHGRELIAVADALGMDRPTLIGHSYGGIVSLAACLAAPRRFRRAVLIEAWLDALVRDEVVVPMGTKRFYPDAERAAARFRLLPADGWPVPELLRYVGRHSVHETEAGWTFKFDDRIPLTLNADASTQQLRAVRVPLDFVHGDRTDVVAHDLIGKVQEILPTCTAPVSIPLAHHHAILEQPVAFVATLTALLAAHDA